MLDENSQKARQVLSRKLVQEECRRFRVPIVRQDVFENEAAVLASDRIVMAIEVRRQAESASRPAAVGWLCGTYPLSCVERATQRSVKASNKAERSQSKARPAENAWSILPICENSATTVSASSWKSEVAKNKKVQRLAEVTEGRNR